ncbi:hypothetical protein GCM10022395_06390 [Snuella lapsa]|uniref:Uncharacterized protein n=2 Tax=Snuella lapsa TaxID=870481 RepID=A0ABP6WZ13_9FLAO
MAEANRGELVKVLEYFKKENNKEKIQSAEFLVANLPYNYSYDTLNLHKYDIIYRTYDSLKALKKLGEEINVNDYMNKFWDSLKTDQDPYRNIYYRPIKEDVKSVTGDFLIKNINQAYASWKDNPYSRDSVPFKDFCEYVLPYRQIQGKSIEDWRSFFILNSKNHFSDSYPIPFTKACDSFFQQYKDYRFDYWLMQGFPILRYKDFMKIKQGKCTIKSWFNTYAVNAEGIPMVADFVPAWGHREDDHQWNALLYGGKTLYFESYWEQNHSWFYNPNINNNLFEDDWSGKIRLPKVYRHTFSTHFEGPISDDRVSLENIPQLFRNVKKKDVSNEYFKAKDVTVNITKEIPKDTYYVYLCVLGVNKNWVPVHWGKLEGKKASFTKMGTDIVYQVAFYNNGTIVPCGVPFHLTADGEINEFRPGKGTRKVAIKRKYPAKNGWLKGAHLLKGALIQASNRKDFKGSIALREIDFYPELRPYDLTIKSKKRYRYYRIFSKDKITVREIDLFDENSKEQGVPLEGEHISVETDTVTWKGIDLGKPRYVSTFRFTPRNNLNHVLEGNKYELFYIDEGNFISLGIKKADSSYELKFDNVPEKALLYLKCLDGGRQQRIFEYEEGKQIWY